MSKIDRAKISAVAVAVAMIAFFAYWQRKPNVAEIGGMAPDFTLLGLDTGSGSPPLIHLGDFRGKVVLVNFWATWCPPCIEETPSLEKFSAQMKNSGVEVIGVSVDQDPQALKNFVAQYHLTFPIARDPDQVVSARFGTYQFPETYILDRDGRVAEKIISSRDWTNPLMISFVNSLAQPGNSPATQ